MFGRLQLDEFASIVGFEAEWIQQYRRMGLIDPDGDGWFEREDVLRVQMIRLKEESGENPEGIAASLRSSGDTITERLFRSPGDFYSLDDAAAKVGLQPDQVAALATALGFPESAFDSWDDRDLEALRGVSSMTKLGIPWEGVIEGAKVYGDVLRRLAEAEIRMTHQYLCEEMRAHGANEGQIASAFYQAGDTILDIVDELVRHLHHDHMLAALIDHALAHLQESEAGAHGTFVATILFVDLSLFTSLAEVHGDETAAEVLGRFDEIVRRRSVNHGGILLKQIGDSFMVSFSDPKKAVESSIQILQDSGKEADFPAIRIGIHTGPVLFRVGDYVGSTVNIASRVVGMAMPNAILLTEPVAKAVENAPGIELEEIGLRRARGVAEPLALYRVRSTKDTKDVDPVCGMIPGEPAAGRLVHDGIEYSFCSKECLQKFLDDPSLYAKAS